MVNGLVHNCPQEYLPGFLPEGLKPGEGNVGTYSALYYRNGRSSFDNVTPHHMPSDAYMQNQLRVHPDATYTHSTAITMNMSQSRRARTSTFRHPPDYTLTPRQALARDLWEVRNIYRSDSLYITPSGDTYIVGQLREVARRNRKAFSDIFAE